MAHTRQSKARPILIDSGFVRENQYYTDNNRLYRIVTVNADETVQVENCETLFTHLISLDTVLSWTEVNCHALRA